MQISWAAAAYLFCGGLFAMNKQSWKINSFAWLIWFRNKTFSTKLSSGHLNRVKTKKKAKDVSFGEKTNVDLVDTKFRFVVWKILAKSKNTNIHKNNWWLGGAH